MPRLVHIQRGLLLQMLHILNTSYVQLVHVVIDMLRHCRTLSQFGIQIYMILLVSSVCFHQSLQIFLLPSLFRWISEHFNMLTWKMISETSAFLRQLTNNLEKFVTLMVVEISSKFYFRTWLMMMMIAEAHVE